MGQGTDGLDPLVGQAERGREDRGPDDGHEHRRNPLREAGQHEEDGEDGEPDHERGRVGLVEPVDERTDFVDEAVRVGGEAEQLGQLPHDDGDREAVHVADLHLLGQQVGDEAELAEAEPDLDEAHEEREHPGEGDRGRGIIAGDEERRDGGEDEGPERRVGAEHQHARRAEDRVADQAGDGGVQAGDRREAGQLGVGHALRHEDGGQHYAGDDVEAQPGPLVGAQRRGRPAPSARPAWSVALSHVGAQSAHVRREAGTSHIAKLLRRHRPSRPARMTAARVHLRQR